MVWQYRVGLIVMATSLVENGKIKCHRYWPDFAGTKGNELDSNLLDLECGMIVSTHEVARARDFTVTTIKLEWQVCNAHFGESGARILLVCTMPACKIAPRPVFLAVDLYSKVD